MRTEQQVDHTQKPVTVEGSNLVPLVLRHGFHDGLMRSIERTRGLTDTPPDIIRYELPGLSPIKVTVSMQGNRNALQGLRSVCPIDRTGEIMADGAFGSRSESPHPNLFTSSISPENTRRVGQVRNDLTNNIDVEALLALIRIREAEVPNRLIASTVGVFEYFLPELQGQPIRTVERVIHEVQVKSLTGGVLLMTNSKFRRISEKLTLSNRVPSHSLNKDTDIREIARGLPLLGRSIFWMQQRLEELDGTTNLKLPDLIAEVLRFDAAPYTTIPRRDSVSGDIHLISPRAVLRDPVFFKDAPETFNPFRYDDTKPYTVHDVDRVVFGMGHVCPANKLTHLVSLSKVLCCL